MKNRESRRRIRGMDTAIDGNPYPGDIAGHALTEFLYDDAISEKKDGAMDIPKDWSRQGLFAKLKGQNGYLADETFGLFLEEKTGTTSPFCIETVLESYFGVASCADIETPELAKLIGEFEKWTSSL